MGTEFRTSSRRGPALSILESAVLREVATSTTLTSGHNFYQPLVESFVVYSCAVSLLPRLHNNQISRSFIQWYVEDFRVSFPGTCYSSQGDQYAIVLCENLHRSHSISDCIVLLHQYGQGNKTDFFFFFCQNLVKLNLFYLSALLCLVEQKFAQGFQFWLGQS